MENIKLDDFTKYTYLSSLRFSPDGSHACFAVHNADVEGNSYTSNLWLYSKEKNNYFQLTALNKESRFTWMDDSSHIIFPAVRNPKDKEKLENGEEFTQFYKINIHGGEAKEAFRINKKVSEIKQIDNNLFIFTASCNLCKTELDGLSEEDKAKELKKWKEEKDYEVVDEIPFWSNGGGFVNKDRNRLFIYDAEINKLECLTSPDLNVDFFELNENKTKLLFSGNSFEHKMELTNTLYLLNLTTKEINQVSPQESFFYSYANFISEDAIICTGTDMKQYGLNENDKFYLIDIHSKSKKCLTPDLDCSIGSSVGSDCRYGGGNSRIRDNNYIYFTTTENESSYLNRIDVNGITEKVTCRKGSVDTFSVSNGQILFIGLRDYKLQELYSLYDNLEKQVTHFNDWFTAKKNVLRPEKIVVNTAPNVTIDGWILKPADFEENKLYPAILDIHGGPKTAYGEVFVHEMQYWANEGYVVFFCNPRGSDGKGSEFADIRGKYGTIDFDDIMKFTDAVLEKYTFIDKNKVGVTGGSYGGYMTNWIIGHTDRFKAAASQRSISNWTTEYCTTDIGYFFVEDQIDSTPWSDYEKLWWHSPLKYADKVKTPTLFLHSDEDYRCWMAEAIQMFTALKYHGIESRLIMFKGENHELSRSGKPKHRIRRLEEITEWFNKYLK